MRSGTASPRRPEILIPLGRCRHGPIADQPVVSEPQAAASALAGVDPDPPDGPINWLTLKADEAQAAFLDLDRWVSFIRVAYGLPPTIVPPYWHRHDELIWELSALHLHWLNSFHHDSPPSAPAHWHHDFALARVRLREWVATSGTRLDRDRPTRVTAWPGEPAVAVAAETVITDREEDFRAFLREDYRQRTRSGPEAHDRQLPRTCPPHRA